MFTSKTKRVVALMLAFVLTVSLAACGGKDSIPNGKYESDGGSFTYLDFKGGKVEIGSGFGNTTISTETVKYTYKDGTLSFTAGGIPVDLPCSVSGNTLTLGADKYYKGGVPADDAQHNDGNNGNNGNNANNVDSIPDTQVNKAGASNSSAFDGEYVGDRGTTLTITNGEYKFEGFLFGGNSGTVNEDGSLNATASYVGDFRFVHEHESYYYVDLDGSKKEFNLVGGKSLFQYIIEEQTAGFPAITLAHQYDDTPVLRHEGSGSIEIIDGVFYIQDRVLSEDPVLNTAKRLFWCGTIYGSQTFFFVDDNKDLWGIGKNDVGQLGDGTGVDKDNPVKILSDVVDVKTNNIAHIIYAFKSDNTVWRWGLIGNNKVYAPELFASDVAEMYCLGTGAMGGEPRCFVFLKTNGDLVLQQNAYARETNELVAPITLMHKVKAFYPEKFNNYTPYGAFVVFSDDSLHYYPKLLSGGISAEPAISAADSEKLFDNAFIYAQCFLDYDSLWGVDNKGDEPWIVQTNDGILYGKGKNNKGQLGDGTKIDRDDWIKIADGVESYGMEKIDYANNIYHYIKTDGTRWEWTTSDPTPKMVVEETAE